jgi:hypothetical protein
MHEHEDTMKKLLHTYLGLMLLVSAFAVPAGAQEIRYSEQALSGESVVHVSITGGKGTFILKRATSNDVYTVREKSDDDGPAAIDAQYTVKGDAGFLTLDLNNLEDGDDLNTLSAIFSGGDTREYYITLTDRIPVYLDMKIGAGDGRIDLTGLRLRRLSLECGATELRIRVGETNPEVLREVKLAAGIGQLMADRLGNLNFERFAFDGGVGEYQLDFTGQLRDRSQVSADIGVGSLRLVFPHSAGVLAHAEDNWLNSAEFTHFTQNKKGVYASENYRSADRKVLLKVQSGIGSVSINWK